MNQNSLALWAQILSVSICLPIYAGFLIYAYWGPNKARLQSLASIPFQDEGDSPQ
jgi:hypothetical protein